MNYVFYDGTRISTMRVVSSSWTTPLPPPPLRKEEAVSPAITQSKHINWVAEGAHNSGAPYELSISRRDTEGHFSSKLTWRARVEAADTYSQKVVFFDTWVRFLFNMDRTTGRCSSISKARRLDEADAADLPGHNDLGPAMGGRGDLGKIAELQSYLEHRELLRKGDRIRQLGRYHCEWAALQAWMTNGTDLPATRCYTGASVAIHKPAWETPPYRYFCWDHLQKLDAMTKGLDIPEVRPGAGAEEMSAFLEQYNSQLQADAEADLTTTRTELETWQRAEAEAREHIATAERERREREQRLERQGKDATERLAKAKETFAAQIDTVLRFPQIEAIRAAGPFGGRGFFIKTHRLDSPRLTDGTIRDLGRFEIRVDVRNTNVRIMRIKEEGDTRLIDSDHQHPHVDSGGGPCLGNLESALPAAFARGEVEYAVSLVITYLESINEFERWGQLVYRWPLSPNSPTGFAPRRRIGCVRCASTYGSCQCCPNCKGVKAPRLRELEEDPERIFHDSAGTRLWQGGACRCVPCRSCGLASAEFTGQHDPVIACVRCAQCDKPFKGVPARGAVSDSVRTERIVEWSYADPKERPCPHHYWCPSPEHGGEGMLVNEMSVLSGSCLHAAIKDHVMYPQGYEIPEHTGQEDPEAAAHQALIAQIMATPEDQIVRIDPNAANEDVANVLAELDVLTGEEDDPDEDYGDDPLTDENHPDN